MPDKSIAETIEIKPAFYAVLMFLAGIILGRSSSSDPFILLIVISAALFVIATAPSSARALFVTSIIAGACLILIHDHYPEPKNDVSHYTSGRKKVNVEVEFLRLDSKRIKYDRYLFKALAVDGAPVSGTVQASARSRKLLRALAGDRFILGKVTLKKIHGFRNIDGWDYEQYMRDLGIGAKLGGVKDKNIRYLKSDWRWRRPFERLKNKLRRNIIAERTDVTAVMSAMLIGDQGQASPRLRDIFSRAGTAHLLAVSGLHVGFIAAISYFILKILIFYLIYPFKYHWASAGLPMRLAAIGAALIVLGYGLLTGPRLPSLRAMIMIDSYLLAVAVGRGRDFYGAFSVAMFIVLLFMPWSIFMAGFQLSFAAVFFITVFLERWWKPVHYEERTVDDLAPVWWRTIYARFPLIGSYAAMSLFATIGTAPIVAYHFNIIPFYSVFINTLLTPVASVAVPLGMAGALISSQFLMGVTSVLTGFIIDMTRWIAEAPFSYRYIPSIPSVAPIFYYSIIALFLLLEAGHRRRQAIAIASIALAVSLVVKPLGAYFDPDLTIKFVDVGQGDSTVAVWPNGGALVIDAGNRYSNFDLGRSIVAPVVWRSQRTRLNAIFATHSNMDHIGGIPGLVERVPTAMLGTHKKASGYMPFGRLRAQALLDGIYNPLKAGDHLDFAGGLSVEVLNPPAGALPFKDTSNDRSLVLKLVYGNVRVLTVGDISSKVERWLVDSGADISADVLKVGHHGSKNSSSKRFLNAVGAKYAVISAGYNNRYRHPSTRALERLKKAGMKIYRTDIDGEVVMRTDGEKIEFITYAGAAPSRVGP
ncbi:DNA internalization-related competence protein ComEC/Rec2 [hydrothermal vent metagenome]|uniref:DNA internalization-related competence protein ComEC/Rec2 n=1 Tax=hydrothermal vent metagenome TaxID=652676 RepID=A0A3B1C6T5_9ZZZZ